MPNQYAEVLRLAKELVKAEADSLKAGDAVRNLDLKAGRGSSTTAHARWTRAAEYRDKVRHQLHVAVVRAGIAERFEDSYYGELSTGDKWCPTHILREKP